MNKIFIKKVITKKLLTPTVIVFLIIICINGYSQSSISIPNPHIWYRADNSLNSDNEVHDFSGKMHNAHCTSGFNIIDTGIINYNKAFIYDQDDFYIGINNIAIDKNRLVIFSIYRSKISNEEQSIWTIYLDSLNISELQTQKLKTFTSDKIYSNITDTNVILNTTSIGWLDIIEDTIIDYILIGNGNSLPLKGELAEIMFYNNELDSIDILKIQSYLAMKYGITLYKSNYIDCNNNIIWNYHESIPFIYNIATIGKDSASTLNQKQSSGNGGRDILSIGAGIIADNNEDNNYYIPQGNFLIWSDNGEDINTLDTNFFDSLSLVNLSLKKWLMQVNGMSARSIPTQLKINIKDLNYNNELILIIDRSATGVFSQSNVDIINPDSIDDNNIYFSNIYWDTDYSGKDIFTFLISKNIKLLASGDINDNLGVGNISIEVINGEKPYHYTIRNIENDNLLYWTNNESNQYINNILPGIYSITVIDNKNRCDSSLVILDNTKYSANNSNRPDISDRLTNFEYIKIYPNPTDGHYKIYVKLYEINNIIMKIWDQNGKLIELQKRNGYSDYIFEGMIETGGIYYVECITNNERLIKKLEIVR